MKKHKEIARCPACGTPYILLHPHRRRTTHHIWPQKFYGGQGPKIDLCMDCHCELHREIPRLVMLEPSEYQEILDLFLFAKRVPQLCHA